MPPTFLLFLGLIVYLGLTTLTCLIFIPQLFFDKTKLLAKKVMATVLVSFPCLLISGLLFSLIFLIPALLFLCLTYQGHLSKTLEIAFSITGILIFTICVASFSLYLWYFVSHLIYHRLDNRPIHPFLAKDKVLQFLQPYLIKFKLYHPAARQKQV